MNETPDPQQPEPLGQPIEGPALEQPLQPLAPEIVAPSSNPQAYAPPQYVQPENPQPQYPAQPQYAQPAYAQPTYAQTQYAQAYGAVPPAKKGLSTGAIVGIVAGSLVLMLVVFGGLIAAGSILSWTDTTSSSYSVVDNVDPTGAAETVEEYLTAIADGDAKKARDMLGETSSNQLLADEVLKKSQQLAPMSNIEIDTDSMQLSPYDVTLAVSFDLGKKTITRDFSVYKSYSDGWSISDGLVGVSLSTFDGLGPTINGVKPTEDYAEVFPGAYEITLENKAFTIGDGSGAFIFANNGSDANAQELEPVLTDESKKTFTKLVSDSLNECLKSTNLTTPCGQDIDAEQISGTKISDGDVKRTLTSRGEADLKAIEPQRDWVNPTRVSAFLFIDIKITLLNSKPKQSEQPEVLYGGPLLTPYVDFADENPSVTWE